MNLYKTELHAHTSPVSDCGVATVAELIDCYVKVGYHTVVLTNHMSHRTYHDEEILDWHAAVDFYLSDYYDAVKQAEGKLHILLGMEICFDKDGETDYLVYGVTPEFLYSHGNLMKMSIASFSKLAHEHGLLVIQAHPFRNFMRITPPHYLDGVEVVNGNPRLDSRNDLAKQWAERFDFLTTSGSDFHMIGDEGFGGIQTDAPITTNQQLLEIIRTNNKTLIDGAAN